MTLGVNSRLKTPKFSLLVIRLICVFLFVGLFSCNPEPTPYLNIKGEAQGTSFNIICQFGGSIDDLQNSIDSVFVAMDNSVSNYTDSSVVWLFNHGLISTTTNPDFIAVFKASQEMYQLTSGAFDPTVYPLVKAWGFGPEGPTNNNVNVDSLMEITGFSAVTFQDSAGRLKLKLNHRQLDFNAIAQGYTVDRLGKLFNDFNIPNYMIEVGGEVVTKGLSYTGNQWNIGIDKPIEDGLERDLQTVVSLKNKSLATSGNYRKFYEKDGQKLSHTISPFTGKPVNHSLLSVTLIGDNCAKTDALATAAMVWGLEKTRTVLQRKDMINFGAYLIFSSDSGELRTEIINMQVEVFSDK